MPHNFHDYNERPITPAEAAIVRHLAAHAKYPVVLPHKLESMTVFVLKGDERTGYIDLVDWNLLPTPTHSRMTCFSHYTDSDGETIEFLLFALPDGTPISLEGCKLNGADLVTYPKPEDLTLWPDG